MDSAAEICRCFVDFFVKRGHRHVDSSPLVPGNDPTLLFTNSGMVQFKDVFLGFDKRPYKRAVTVQRCLRAGGKHNDLENVGYTTRHHTFFEMLGNFSFGDYFKEKAIPFAWEFLTSKEEGLGIAKEHLWVTVFGGGKMFGDDSEAVPADDEARDIWIDTLQKAGFSKAEAENRVTAIPTSDNFWMMGETGPCGPCSEIFFNRDRNAKKFEGEDPGKADFCVEIWNLVFMQFNRGDDGVLRPLPAPCVDTGMGLERIAAVMIVIVKGAVEYEGFRVSNYETDRFQDLFSAVDKAMIEFGCESAFATSEMYEQSNLLHPNHLFLKAEIPYRVIADHIRAASFLIFDGVWPLNEGRGYVLRRIIRRALRYGYQLGADKPFFHKLVAVLAREMPDLEAKESLIREEILREEVRFFETIESGMYLLLGEISDVSRCRAILERNFGHAKRNFGHAERNFGDVLMSQLATTVNVGPMRIPKFRLGKRDNAKERVCQNMDNEQQLKRIAAGRSVANDADGERLPVVGGKLVSEHSRSIKWARSAYALFKMGADLESLKMEMLEKGFAKDEAKRLDALVKADPPLDSDSSLAKVGGEFAFKLYDTYGFPLDLTADIARECGLEVDEAAFDKCMQAQRERSRAASKFNIGQKVVVFEGAATEFVGYASTALAKCEAKIAALFVGDEARKEARAGEEALLILDRSPFYAESGGQIGDSGIVESVAKDARAKIADTQKIRSDIWGHKAKIESGALRVGDAVVCRVDAQRRAKIKRNHSATHLLHSALRRVLGGHIEQRGSLVADDYLRFDVSHGKSVAPEELTQVEEIVNEQIRANAKTKIKQMSYDDAVKKRGATALFGEKYGDKVRVVTIDPEFSIELCGGAHVARAGDIGYCHLRGESAVAAGVRRIEAQTGAVAVAAARHLESRLRSLAETLKTPAERIEEKIEALREALKVEQRKTREFESRAASEQARALAAQIETIGGRRALVAAVDCASAGLRDLAARLRAEARPLCLLLVARETSKASVAAAVSAEYAAAIDAREWLQAAAAKMGARGGGKPDFAQAGGGDARETESALAAARDFLRQKPPA